MRNALATSGDLVVWRDYGEKLFNAGLVEATNLQGRVIEARIPTPDGWHVYRVTGNPRVARAASMRNLETLVRSAPLFHSLSDALDYFRPHRRTESQEYDPTCVLCEMDEEPGHGH